MLGSLRQQPTFGDATTSFPSKGSLRSERRNSILMTRHCPDLGSSSDWSLRKGNLLQPINQKHYPEIYPEPGSDASSVWNFCARFSVVISRGNQWLLADFSGSYRENPKYFSLKFVLERSIVYWSGRIL